MLSVSWTPLAVLVTVIVVVPSLSGLTVNSLPETVTVATEGFEETALIVVFVVPAGVETTVYVFETEIVSLLMLDTPCRISMDVANTPTILTIKVLVISPRVT